MLLGCVGHGGPDRAVSLSPALLGWVDDQADGSDSFTNANDHVELQESGRQRSNDQQDLLRQLFSVHQSDFRRIDAKFDQITEHLTKLLSAETVQTLDAPVVKQLAADIGKLDIASDDDASRPGRSQSSTDEEDKDVMILAVDHAREITRAMATAISSVAGGARSVTSSSGAANFGGYRANLLALKLHDFSQLVELVSEAGGSTAGDDQTSGLTGIDVERWAQPLQSSKVEETLAREFGKQLGDEALRLYLQGRNKVAQNQLEFFFDAYAAGSDPDNWQVAGTDPGLKYNLRLVLAFCKFRRRLFSPALEDVRLLVERLDETSRDQPFWAMDAIVLCARAWLYLEDFSTAEDVCFLGLRLARQTRLLDLGQLDELYRTLAYICDSRRQWKQADLWVWKMSQDALKRPRYLPNIAEFYATIQEVRTLSQQVEARETALDVSRNFLTRYFDGNQAEVKLFMSELTASVLSGENKGLTASGSGWSLIHTMACDDRTDRSREVRLLLAEGSRVDDSICQRGTALHLSALSENGFVLEELLLSGAAIDCLSSKGQTPLHLAIRDGRLGSVNWLLAFGADDQSCVSIQSGSGVLFHRSMHIVGLSARHTHLDIAKYLIDRGDLSDEALISGLQGNWTRPGAHELFELAERTQPGFFVRQWKPILCGCMSTRYTETVLAIIDRGVNLRDPGPNNDPLIGIAAESGLVTVVEAILSQYPDQLNVVDEKQRTPLYRAVEGDQEDVVKFLLEWRPPLRLGQPAGAGNVLPDPEDLELEPLLAINQQGPSGTPLYLAVAKNRHRIVRTLLVTLEADGPKDFVFDDVRINQLSMIDIAVSHGYIESLRVFLPTMNSKNYNYRNATEIGDTPLIAAIRGHHHQVVELLINYKANINGTNNAGETALMVAVQELNLMTLQAVLVTRPYHLTDRKGPRFEQADSFGRKAVDFFPTKEASNARSGSAEEHTDTRKCRIMFDRALASRDRSISPRPVKRLRPQSKVPPRSLSRSRSPPAEESEPEDRKSKDPQSKDNRSPFDPRWWRKK